MMKRDQLVELIFIPDIFSLGLIRIRNFIELDRVYAPLILIQGRPHHPLPANTNLLKQGILTKRRARGECAEQQAGRSCHE